MSNESKKLKLFEALYSQIGDGCILKGLEIARIRFYKLAFENAASNNNIMPSLQDYAMDSRKYMDTIDGYLNDKAIKPLEYETSN